MNRFDLMLPINERDENNSGLDSQLYAKQIPLSTKYSSREKGTNHRRFKSDNEGIVFKSFKLDKDAPEL